MAMSREAPINHFERLPMNLWTQVFCRVPHVTRLKCRSVCSNWDRFLKSEQLRAQRRPPSCLAIGVDVSFYPHHGQWDDLYEVEGDPFCFAFGPSGDFIPLPIQFPRGWKPEDSAGGFRSAGGLVAFVCGRYYRVGNPVHNQWENVSMEVNTMAFGRNGFELVADEKDGGCYQIVAFGINETDSHPRVIRSHNNWVMQVYSSKTRNWKMGTCLRNPVFRTLCDVRVFERSVYFLGWIVAPAPRPTVQFQNCLLDPTVELQLRLLDPAAMERRIRIRERYNSLTVWRYDIDSDKLSEVVAPAKYVEENKINFPPHYETNQASIRLHLFRPQQQQQAQGQAGTSSSASATSTSSSSPGPAGLHISLIVLAAVNKDDVVVRLQVDEQDGPSSRCWSINSMFLLKELTSGGPGAPAVADDWGLTLFSFLELDRLFEAAPFPRPRMNILCYQKDLRRWVEWSGYVPTSKTDWDSRAVEFLPCECCATVPSISFS